MGPKGRTGDRWVGRRGRWSFYIHRKFSALEKTHVVNLSKIAYGNWTEHGSAVTCHTNDVIEDITEKYWMSHPVFVRRVTVN